MSFETPDDVIFQELASFAVFHGINIGVRELRMSAIRVYDRLNSIMLSHREASTMLSVHPDTLHGYRKDGYVEAIAKNPSAKRKRWLYRLCDVLELKRTRPSLQIGGNT